MVIYICPLLSICMFLSMAVHTVRIDYLLWPYPSVCVRSCVGQLHGHAWASGGGYVSMYGLCNRLGFLGGFVDAGPERLLLPVPSISTMTCFTILRRSDRSSPAARRSTTDAYTSVQVSPPTFIRMPSKALKSVGWLALMSWRLHSVILANNFWLYCHSCDWALCDKKMFWLWNKSSPWAAEQRSGES